MAKTAPTPFVTPTTFSALLSPMDDRSVVLDDGSDIASITSTDLNNDDEEIETVSTEDALDDELNVADDED